MFSWDFTPFFRPNADDIYEQSIAYYSDEKIKKTTESNKKRVINRANNSNT